VEKAGPQGCAPASRLRTPPPTRPDWLPHHRLSPVSCLPHRNHQPQPASNMPTTSTPRLSRVCPSKNCYMPAIHGSARKFPLCHSVLPATTRQAQCISVARPFVISKRERSYHAQSAKSWKLPCNKTSLLIQASKLRRRREVSSLGFRSTLSSLDMCLSSTNHVPARLRIAQDGCVHLNMLKIAVLGPS
jgi:hypothetical protein